MTEWLNFENLEMEINTSILIKEPPCSTCKNWKPHKEIQQFVDGSVKVVGISCCTSSSMYKDFSCYNES